MDIIVINIMYRKLTDIAAELNSFRDARACIQLSDKTLPSICCYTFHNASDKYDGLSL